MRRYVFLALLAAMLLPATIVKAETTAEKQMAQRIGSQLKQSGKLRDYRMPPHLRILEALTKIPGLGKLLTQRS